MNGTYSHCVQSCRDRQQTTFFKNAHGKILLDCMMCGEELLEKVYIERQRLHLRVLVCRS